MDQSWSALRTPDASPKGVRQIWNQRPAFQRLGECSGGMLRGSYGIGCRRCQLQEWSKSYAPEVYWVRATLPPPVSGAAEQFAAAAAAVVAPAIQLLRA